MGKYIFSGKAEEDLIEIYRYGFLNYGEQKADLYVGTLKDKCQILANDPFPYREYDEFIPPVRIHSHKKHLIIYTAEKDRILIIRILHERMNVHKQLKD